MSSLPKCRRVKRPTILAKRSQLVKKNLYKKRSYKPLYEKLKGNNNALAKALSKEKQECQYLFTENLALTSEVQELAVAVNKRDDIISGVLKNSKDTLALLVTLTNHVTNTIASCQQVVASSRFTPRKSTSAVDRRDSNRRLSGKSPARGVVQPMVGGHTITKPTINLSRLNIQREYRVQNAPNLSDIEEGPTTPEHSPPNAHSVAPARVPPARPLNCIPRRIDRMPERLQRSLGTSDESERRSSIRGNRNSARHSLRRSRRDSEIRTTEVLNDQRLRSPRVSLHDVSRLLQNSQSVNIRTLLETSCDMELTQTQQSQVQTPGDVSIREDHPTDGSLNLQTSENDATLLSSPSSAIEVKNTKDTSSRYRESDDPLEGPSWLLNDSEVASSSDQVVSTTVRDSPVINDKETKKIIQISVNDGNSKNVSAEEEEETETEWVNETAEEEEEKKKKKKKKEEEEEVEQEEEEEEEEEEKKKEEEEKEEEEEEEDDDDDDRTANLATRWIDHEANFYRNLNHDDERTDTNIPNFVTRKRGSHCDDTEDFTLMWRRPAAKNYNFDINDLELPVIDSPIVRAPQTRLPEPEITANVQIITTQNIANLTSVCPRIDEQNDTFVDSLRLAPPSLPENPNVLGTSVVEQNERSDEENDENDSVVGKRKRRYKKSAPSLDPLSDSDWTPTPKRRNLKDKRKQRTKDPSSVKVVLRKLKDERIVKGTSSPEIRQSQENDIAQRGNGSPPYPEPSSDSEASNASSNKLTVNAEVHGRPRRQKAPKNLQEPSLGKKLRRQ